MDLNTLFGEFLKKVVTEAVAEATKSLVEQNETLLARVTELENQMGEMTEKVDECDVERAVERHFESINITEMLDLDRITEDVVCSRGFNDAVRESLIESLQRGTRY